MRTIAYIPTLADIENLCIGDTALDCFGQESEVIEIFARNTDIKGKRFVCYYTKLSDNAKVSGSMKEDELIRTVPLTGMFNSTELNHLEKQMLFDEQRKLIYVR